MGESSFVSGISARQASPKTLVDPSGVIVDYAFGSQIAAEPKLASALAESAMTTIVEGTPLLSHRGEL
jgi:hypothetical protein